MKIPKCVRIYVTFLQTLNCILVLCCFLLWVGKARKALPKRPVPEGESSESSEEIKSPRSSSFDSLVISRLEEKEELQHLNDRFANYIEHLHKNIFNKEFSGHIDLLTNSLKVSPAYSEKY